MAAGAWSADPGKIEALDHDPSPDRRGRRRRGRRDRPVGRAACLGFTLFKKRKAMLDRMLGRTPASTPTETI